MMRGDFTQQSRREDIFTISGPTHVPQDWGNSNYDYKRSVAASLIKGVYVVEKDRRQGTQWSDSSAAAWSINFGFTMINTLLDENSEIFGVIYEFMSPRSTNEIPRYVFAFRGTILSSSNDRKHNFRLIRNKLHKSQRIGIAIQAVENHITVNNSDVNWLVGHSLGASTAMLVGKHMAARYGSDCLKSFLFNPPFISLPFEDIKNEKIYHALKIVTSLVTAGVGIAAVIKHYRRNPEQLESFLALKEWVPNLFVNTGDKICKGYVAYFTHRVWMNDIGLGEVERFATRHATLAALMSVTSKEIFQTVHLIPSANLTVNSSHYPGLTGDHELSQWWRADLNMLENKVYMY